MKFVAACPSSRGMVSTRHVVRIRKADEETLDSLAHRRTLGIMRRVAARVLFIPSLSLADEALHRVVSLSLT